MVRVNVSQLLQEPIGATREYEVDAEINIAGGPSPVRGQVALTRTDRGILVQGRIEIEIGLTCSRCLAQSRLPISLDIAEEYFPMTDVLSGAPLPVPDVPGSFTIDESHVIDLTEAIRQYAEMKVPMKPLCRDSCAGICPSCGRNLNEGACDCRRQEADPRWAVLLEAKDAGRAGYAGKAGAAGRENEA